MIETTYAHVAAHLEQIMDEVSQNRDIVIVQRAEGDDVALIAADELRGLLETAHLLRPPQERRAPSGGPLSRSTTACSASIRG